jgi:lysophospholipase L1-like esterase
MRRSLIAYLYLVLGGTLTAVLILEVALRLGGISYPYFYIPDPHTGYVHKANAEGWWQKEGQAYIRINSAGLRDREHAKPKPHGTFRIAVLGDSYTEAVQVVTEQTFWTILERELQQCQALAGRQVEVINFGVSGYGTGQELLALRYRAWDYSPDLVILAFLTGNDIRNNSRELDDDPTKAYFLYRDGQLVLDASFRDSIAFVLRQMNFSYQAFEYSRVLQVVREARYKIGAYLREVTHRKMVTAEVGSETDLDAMVYLDPKNPLWEEAWRVTEGLIILMRDEIKANGADFLLVTLTNPDQVHPDPRQRREVANKLGVRDLLYPDLRLKAWGEQQGVPMLSLVQPMMAYAEQRHVFLHGFPNAKIGDGHWNAEGHRLAGQLISGKVCAGLRSN